MSAVRVVRAMIGLVGALAYRSETPPQACCTDAVARRQKL